MRPVGVAERRARLVRRHHLATPAATVEAVAGDLVGLHSSDPASVYLSARARVADFDVADLEAALYERRSLVRLLGMRRTMFVVPRELGSVVNAACTAALAPAERRRLIKMLEDQGISSNGERWLARVEARTLDALAIRDEATAAELTEDVPELGEKLRFGEGKSWAGTVGISTRVLFLLAAEARILRARPLGTWISSQYRWTLTEGWLDEGLREIPAPEARADLLRRWLYAFGPGTLTDVRWWTGWTVRQSRQALADVGAVEIDLDGGSGYLLPDDLEVVRDVEEPCVALLPALDSTVMGWKARDWYLGDHGGALFDRNGNAGPTVWCDGRVAGGWALQENGKVVLRLLDRLDAERRSMLEVKGAQLEAWLGETRITPRFRTPLEKELCSKT